LRPIVCVEEVLAVDLNVWDGVVTRRRSSTHECGSSACPPSESLHDVVAITSVRTDNEWRSKLHGSMLGTHGSKLG
jgi:hypothetical protein